MLQLSSALENIDIEEFRMDYLSEVSSLNKQNYHIFKDPFKAVVLDDFLLDEGSNLEDLLEEALKVANEPLSNDLYNFHQSTDISNFDRKKFPKLVELRQLLLIKFQPLINKLIKNGESSDLHKGLIDLTVSIYRKGDYLLCHDDMLDERRVAFIYYLVDRSWDVTRDGGALDLISHSPIDQSTGLLPGTQGDDFHPWTVVHSLMPKFNSLAFFEVCPTSFHQVAEVLGSLSRVSINGWFHGPSHLKHPKRDLTVLYKSDVLRTFEVDQDLIFAWINHSYLDEREIKKIRCRFISASEIQLNNFLAEDKWLELCETFQQNHPHKWLRMGPMDFRHFSVSHLPFRNIAEAEMPDLWRQLLRLFSSDPLALILTQLTGLKFFDENNEDNNCQPVLAPPYLRRFQRGDYTVMADDEDSQDENDAEKPLKIEAVLHLAGYGIPENDDSEATDPQQPSCSRSSSNLSEKSLWRPEFGGQTVYYNKLDKEPLLAITPCDNALSLTCVESHTVGFMSYVRKSSQENASNAFYDLFAVYTELPACGDEHSYENTDSSEEENCSDSEEEQACKKPKLDQ